MRGLYDLEGEKTSSQTTEESLSRNHPNTGRSLKKKKGNNTTGHDTRTLQVTTRTGVGTVGTGTTGIVGNPTTTQKEKVRKEKEKVKEKESRRTKARRARRNQRLPRGERNLSSKERQR